MHLLHEGGENLLARTVSTRPDQTFRFTTRQQFLFFFPPHVILRGKTLSLLTVKLLRRAKGNAGHDGVVSRIKAPSVHKQVVMLRIISMNSIDAICACAYVHGGEYEWGVAGVAIPPSNPNQPNHPPPTAPITRYPNYRQ